MPLHVQTPLLQSRILGRRAGRDVWLKLEALQPTGSFKLRGIGHACEAQRDRGARRLVSSSGGNAGLAVAHAARRLGLQALVVVPESATARAKDLIGGEGAEVLVHGRSWQEANERALALLGPGDAFIHPFDDPLLWEGHATLVDELRAQGPRPEAVVLSVGGGGLLCGVLEGLHRNGWADVPVVAVETEGAESLARAMAAGHLVELPAITSVATSLGARQVAGEALAWTRRHPVRSVVVPDAAAVRACAAFLDDHRLLVEPACGAALAAVYDDLPALQGFRSVHVVVCGGAGTTWGQLRGWIEGR